MVRDHRGHTCSEATQNPCKFFTSLGQSKNPEIQYFQKLPNKNFKVLLKRFLLGSYDLPGFLDFWIIIITWRDYETKSRGGGVICSYQLLSAPVISNQSPIKWGILFTTTDKVSVRVKNLVSFWFKNWVHMYGMYGKSLSNCMSRIVFDSLTKLSC